VLWRKQQSPRETAIEKFWLDTGLDGFMWDAGLMDPKIQTYQVDLPKTYTANDTVAGWEGVGSC